MDNPTYDETQPIGTPAGGDGRSDAEPDRPDSSGARRSDAGGLDLDKLREFDPSDPTERVDEELREMADRGETETLQDVRDCQTMIYQMYKGVVSMAEAEHDAYSHTDEELQVVGKLGGRILQRHMPKIGPNADLMLLGGYLAATWGTKHAQRIRSGTPTTSEKSDEDESAPANDGRTSTSETLRAIEGEEQ